MKGPENMFVHGPHCPVRSLFIYLIAKAKGRTTQTCCRAEGQTLLTLVKEEVTVVTASIVAPVYACVRV